MDGEVGSYSRHESLPIYLDEFAVSKRHDFTSGQKITHEVLGIGIIVGFSQKSGEPFAFFYSKETQKRYDSRLVCVSSEELKPIS